MKQAKLIRKLFLFEQFGEKLEKVTYIFGAETGECVDDQCTENVHWIKEEKVFTLGYDSILEDEDGKSVRIGRKDKITFYSNGDWCVKRHVPWWKKLAHQEVEVSSKTLYFG